MNALVEAKQKLNSKDALIYATAQNFELLLDVTAEITVMFDRFSSELTSEVLKAADNKGNLVIHRLLNVQGFLNKKLPGLFEHHRNVMFSGMNKAIDNIQNAHLLLYDYYLGDRILEERIGDNWKKKYPHVNMYNDEQRQEVINAARSRQHNGRNLSDRLWNLENGGKEKIDQRIMQAITNKESATSLAKDLEQYLKPDAKGTRWAYSRLYRMTSKERAKSKKGLISSKPGAPVSTKGISYNAYRLARNEIQQVHWDTYKQTTEIMPWIGKYYWVLGSGHPKIDVCDDYASSNPYKKGEVPDRPHPLCFCWLKAELMDKDKFIAKVKDWMQGNNDFLDEHAQKLGYDFSQSSSAAEVLLVKRWKTASEGHAWGKKNYKSWNRMLTKEEIAAIKHYTDPAGHYKEINGALRGQRKMTNEIRAWINLLDTALSKATTPGDMWVYRGVDPSLFKQFLALRPGDIFQESGFLSTTLAAENKSRYGNIVFKIFVPKGVNAAYVGGISEAGTGETELLLRRNIKLDIIELKKEENLTIITVRVIR